MGRSGIDATVAQMKQEGRPLAANVETLLASGQNRMQTIQSRHLATLSGN
jgi:hypothetical protein